MLLVCCTTFAVPNNFVDELLKLLKETILPKDNTLPKSYYKTKCMLMKLGLSYNSIHACRDGCCLFRKDLLDASECPTCHKLRYVYNSKTTCVIYPWMHCGECGPYQTRPNPNNVDDDSRLPVPFPHQCRRTQTLSQCHPLCSDAQIFFPHYFPKKTIN